MRPIVLCMLVMRLCGPAWSRQSAQTLAQLNRKSCKVGDGAPPGLRTGAQTQDGTLWLGGDAGLFRFAITPRGDHLWIGGELGLARFDGARFVAQRSI